MQKDFIYENYLKMPDDLEFEQAMKVYEELLEENLEEDEIYDKLWDHALHCMIDYGSLLYFFGIHFYTTCAHYIIFSHIVRVKDLPRIFLCQKYKLTILSIVDS